VRLQVITPARMTMTVFRDGAPYSLVETERCFRGACWLLLRGGMLQCVPCSTANFWCTVPLHLGSNHSWFTHPRQIPSETPVAKLGIRGEKCLLILPAKYLLHTAQGYLTCCKILRPGLKVIIPLRRKLLKVYVRFQLLMAASIKLRIFWDVVPCS
jgi:hypothetical protein